jgi:cytoskeleton protein RodZ
MLERRIGAALREARSARKIGIAEISEKLRIRAAFLEAIERGEGAAYFPRPYLVGYLRSYANALEYELGPDLEALAAAIREEREADIPAFRQPHAATAWQRARGGLIVCMLSLVGIYIFARSEDAPVAALVRDDPGTAISVHKKQVPGNGISQRVGATAQSATQQTPVPAKIETTSPTAGAQLATLVPPTPPAPELTEARSTLAPAKPAAEIVAKAPPAPIENASAVQPVSTGMLKTKFVARSAYLREGPSKASGRVATVTRCMRVEVEKIDRRSGWVAVVHGDDTGYLHQTFLADAIPSCGGGADDTH